MDRIVARVERANPGTDVVALLSDREVDLPGGTLASLYPSGVSHRLVDPATGAFIPESSLTRMYEENTDIGANNKGVCPFVPHSNTLRA